MLKDLAGRPRSIARKRFGLLRGLSGVALLLCVLSAAASAQDSAQSEIQDLDGLLNTPVSTAAKYAQGVRQVAGSVTIVTAEDIRRFGYLTLEDVLQGAVGFYQTYDRQYTYTGVRGFGRPADHNNRILLLLDGHTINQGVDGSNQLGASTVIDLASIKRIEIVRGPSSALYGTGAMFAVVNLITNVGSDAGASADVVAGSAGFKRTSMTAGSNLGRNGAFTISALWDETDGTDLYFPEYDSPSSNNGIAQNLDWERRVGLLTSVRVGPVSLRARYGSRAKAIPTGAYGFVFNDPRAESTDEAVSAEVEYMDDLSAVHHLSVRSYVDLFDLSGVAPTLGLPVPADVNGRSRVFGSEAAFHWDLAPTNRLTTGIEYRSNEVADFKVTMGPTELFGIARPFSVTSLYAQNALQLRSNVALIVGVRHDMSTLAGAATAPRLAVIYDPWAGTTFKAMYGEAFRAPSAFEVGFKSFGSTDKLTSERLSMFELIALQRLGARFVLSASAYSYFVRDLIDAAPDTTGSPFVFRNLETARARGVELSLDGRPTGATRLYLNYAFQRAEDAQGDDVGERLTNSPQHLLKAGFGVDLTRHFSAASEIRGESGRVTVGLTETDAFIVTSVNLSLRPFSRGPLGDTEMRVQVANIFNTSYAYPGSIEHRQQTIEQDGRAVFFRLSTRF